jgi:hypothetical protein
MPSVSEASPSLSSWVKKRRRPLGQKDALGVTERIVIPDLIGNPSPLVMPNEVKNLFISRKIEN